ncbi:MAG: phospho-N-acetylmuramoyl-pentapeptide-transferase [Bacteroidales bacterium]|nr:phospho-N-acetylmuramoyl-pentapeptide-transferase [Bacteroidales bacterium]MBN2756847.1 phospho-N-acetylmuramoyl-pentapeptide-transferase [Bacteroidales bacterium]
MFYYLFTYLNKFGFPGAGMFQYISFRSGLAIITSLIISMIYGKKIIRYLQKKQIGEVVRDLGLEGQYQKIGTPTMGGIIIIISILIPTLLFAKLHNIYVILMIITTLWLGIIGFVDDYIKVFKKNKEGLSGRFKIIGQVGLGLIVGLTMYLSDDIVIREKPILTDSIKSELSIIKPLSSNIENIEEIGVKSTKTTIPFVKSHEFDYAYLVAFLGKYKQQAAWFIFIIITIFIITAVSNGANLTDGLDGLATGVSSISVITLGIFAYLSGNIIYSSYLNIMYIPKISELVIFASAIIGATIGFLWYNSYPAQIFMGDTGSLTLGGIIAVFAILVRKELLIPILCGIFLMENLSVMIQVAYFKYTKRKYGEGKRIFKMAPLHHHYQKLGYPESKIVIRFWIIGILLAIVTIITLKIR